MAQNVVLNGITYSVPQIGDQGWSPSLDNYLIALATGVLSLAGGSFPLTNEIDFGGSFGLKSLYLKTESANPASAGFFRLANADAINWRNSGNTADLSLKPDADGILQYGGVDLVTLSATQTLTNKTLTSPTITGTTVASGLTASQAVFTDASKNLVSNAITGTGSVVMSASPTLTGTVTAPTFTATSKFLLNTNGSFTAGSIYKSSSDGLVVSGITGSNYDLAIAAASGNELLANPTGTSNIVLAPIAGATVNIGTTADSVTAKTNLHIQGSTAGYTNAVGLIINAGSRTDDYALVVANAANSLNLLVVNGQGNVGIGTSVPASVALCVTTPISGNSGGFSTGVYSEPVFPVGATSAGINFRTNLTTASSGSPWTMALGADYQAGSAVLGTNCTLTNHVAFLGQALGGTNVSQFSDTNTPVGTSFIYQAGSAANTLGGSLSVAGVSTLGNSSFAGQHLIQSANTSTVVCTVQNNDLTTTSDAHWCLQLNKGSTTATAGSNKFVLFNVNNGATSSGTIASNGTNAAAFFSSSDARLKTNVSPLSGALDKIAALNPVRFNWKSDGTATTGFIAQELAQVMPQLVSKTDDGSGDTLPEGQEPWSVTESGMVPFLVKAIQELKAELDAYKAAHP